jgi:hypothetical protein
MSHRRHRWAAFATSLAACALLAGCSGADDSQSTAAPPTQGRGSSSPDEPTESPSETVTSGATESSSGASGSILKFNPKPGGKHSQDCERLEPGDDPAEFLYYPVMITPPAPVKLQRVTTDHTQGVVDAAAWVAPTGPTPETGTFKGWPPPAIVTSDPNLQWSKRVPVKGAQLDAGVSYNVFLRLQVDPTPGDSNVDGIQFVYQDQDPSSVGTSLIWGARTTFSMSC